MSARVITTLSLAKNKPHITLKVEGFKQRARGSGGTVPSKLPIPQNKIPWSITQLSVLVQAGFCHYVSYVFS